MSFILLKTDKFIRRDIIIYRCWIRKEQESAAGWSNFEKHLRTATANYIGEIANIG